MGYRLPDGGRIDRAKPLSFTFNGERLAGYAGDTLASALIANDRHLVGRSIKYHRPRGIVASGVEEPNALVQLGIGARTIPNLKATEIQLFDGLVATSVNCWPTVRFDLGAVAGCLSGLLSAGFYYKTFMPSQTLWMKVFEPMIRMAAGWGRAPTKADPDFYDHCHVHCDVLVVGGGPAGLAAASTAAAAGVRVILADEQAEFGGALLSTRNQIDGAGAMDWVDQQVAALCANADVRLLSRTTVFGYYQDNYLCALERRSNDFERPSTPESTLYRLWHIRAKHVILTTGAHERPLVFANNDRPGIMLAGAARSYVNRYGVAPGRQAVLLTNNDGAYQAAFDLKEAGIDVAAIVDTRRDVAAWARARADNLELRVLDGCCITGVGGARHVSGVEVRALSEDGASVAGPARKFDCDLVMMSGGWSPVVHLLCHARGRLAFDPSRACFVPDRVSGPISWAGGVGGRFDLNSCLSDGAAAGRKAATAVGASDPKVAPPACKSDDPVVEHCDAVWILPAAHGDLNKHFIDFQNDTTAADILLAVREGFENVEHMKRYTLSGFGTDQGKTGNVNAIANLAMATGQTIDATGTTTFRPPYTPVPFGAMSGRELDDRLDPIRITAIHDWHAAHDAVFEDVGQWKRPWYYPRLGEEMRAAVSRECLAVRSGCGVLDASTLGKIDVQGPDAGAFLDRVYTSDVSGLAVGSIRYGLMCREDGMVFDDGTTTRLATNRFLLTTTTGHADAVLDCLEDYLQTEWSELRVYCTAVTEEWATVALAGPKSRVIMEKICEDIDFDSKSFPFMTYRNGTVAGLSARVFRISFTGELSYEINVAWQHGATLWDAVMAAGVAVDVTPYGTETMHVLRAEKGFIIVGQETDGTVSPQDLGMAWVVSKNKRDFIGKRSFLRADNQRRDRKQLVGILTDDPRVVLPEGAQLVARPVSRPPVAMEGHVTSSYWSATLGRSIALGLVKHGRNRHGERLYAPLEGKSHPVAITTPNFYDRNGVRRDG